jgi:hypothetical protein
MGKINRSTMRGRVYRIREYPDEEEKAEPEALPIGLLPCRGAQVALQRCLILRAGIKENNMERKH